MSLLLRFATATDVPLILEFIRELAVYEKLLDEVQATEARLAATLFPATGRPAAECLLAFVADEPASALGGAAPRPAGFALFFPNYSTFLARPGLYLEDLFVKPEYRGRGIGKALLVRLAKIAAERGCGRMDWAVLDWNAPAIAFYDSLGAIRMPQWQICRLTGPALARYA